MIGSGRRAGRLALARLGTITDAARTLQVHVPPHPLIGHWLATLRSDMTPTPVFRAAMAELGRLLVYEAARDWLPTMEVELNSPCGPAEGSIVDVTKPVKVPRCTAVEFQHPACPMPAFPFEHASHWCSLMPHAHTRLRCIRGVGCRWCRF